MTSSATKYVFKQLTKEYLESALDVIREAFCKDENVCIGTMVNENPKAAKELEKLCEDAAKDGVSFIAIEKTTNKVVSVAFNKIQRAQTGQNEENYFETFSNNCREESSKALIQFMIDVDSIIDIFETIQIDCLMEIMFIATLRQYRGQGLSFQLLKMSKSLAEGLKNGDGKCLDLDGEVIDEKCIPKAISTISTCAATFHLVRKLNFERILECSFEDWEFKGKSFQERIGTSDIISLLCLKL